MRIKNIMQSDNQKNYKNEISFNGGREILRTFSNPDSLASTIFLETFVTGGRGLKEYKKNGSLALRERATDDIVSAVFWMKGVDIFNKIGDKFGEKILKLPVVDFDAGEDALRTPFKNLTADLCRKSNDKKAVNILEKKLAAFKFTKITLSSLLAIGFVGFALPKINHAITEILANKRKDSSVKSFEEKSEKNNSKNYLSCSFEEFDKRFTKNNIFSFSGSGTKLMTTSAHYLENNKICKMLTCDLGILSGRVKTARSKKEGIGFTFRDITSSFFYFASTPLIYKLLQKTTKTTQLTNIDSVTSKQINEILLNQLKNEDGVYASMGVKDFITKTIGVLDDKSKDLISKLPFNSDVISLKELTKFISDENILKRAEEMAKLQPEQYCAGKVLTKQQLSDVLMNGAVNSPEFMQKVYKNKFGESLTNPYKFIPMKQITKFRDNIDKYIQCVIDTAANKNGGVIDEMLLNNINKKSFAFSALFRIIALGISAAALGFLIPALQYVLLDNLSSKNEADKNNYLQKT